MPLLRMKLLGSPLIERDQKPVEISSRKALALWVYLAVSGQEASRDSLATLFWPEQDQSRARAYLRNLLWLLSQAGLEPWIDIRREAIALMPGFELDTADFEKAIRATQQHGHSNETACPDCIPLLSQAVALYRGDFLTGFTLPDSPGFDEWQLFQSDRLSKQLATSLERLARYYDEQGRWPEAIAYAQRWVALDPLHEASQRALMRLYTLNGQRSQALKQYEFLQKALEKELGIGPDEESQKLQVDILTKRLEQHLRPAIAAAPTQQTQPQQNLPSEMTSFIGREREIAEITAILRPQAPGTKPGRLLTLTGPGGSGKTRLALKVAAQLSDRFKDGIFFVALAPEDHPDQVASAIACALGLVEAAGRPVAETIKDSLKSKQLLLVLDNFEHLIAAGPLVSELLAAAPGSQALVTSREVLHVYGEQAYPVLPLALPPLEGSKPGLEMAKYEAVQLFLDRARAVQPGFQAGEHDMDLIADICIRLDGLPLAIELAAARLRLFSLEALHSKLSDKLELLRGGPRDVHSRQRTLRATIDWSFNLLAAEEQQLFARLGIFQGGCTLEAIEQVCCDEDGEPALDGLESLIDKSLVIQQKGAEGEARFGMLETILAYAREKLEEYGEIAEIAGRHARYFAGLAEQAEPFLRGGSEILPALKRLEGEHGNLRATLDWCLSGGNPALGAEMAGCLLFFWLRQDHHAEGRHYIEWALRLSEPAAVAVRAKLFLSAGILAYFREDLEASLANHQEAARLSRQVQDPGSLGWALVFYGGTLGMVRLAQYSEAVALCDEGLNILRTLGDKARIAQALNYVGEMARTRGDYQKAKTVYDECLSLSREIGDSLRELMMYHNMVFVAMREGDYQRAAALSQPEMQLALKVNSTSQYAYTLMSLAGLKAAQNEVEQGARLMGAAEAILDSIGLLLEPADKIEIEKYRADLRARLGEAAYAAELQAGRRLSLQEALALAAD